MGHSVIRQTSLVTYIPVPGRRSGLHFPGPYSRHPRLRRFSASWRRQNEWHCPFRFPKRLLPEYRQWHRIRTYHYDYGRVSDTTTYNKKAVADTSRKRKPCRLYA